MREIKFRGYSKCKGEGWLYGYYRHVLNPNGLGIGVTYSEHKIYDPKTRIETDVIAESVGQFTGMRDDDDNEIYEGDILCLFAGFGEVVYNDDECVWCLKELYKYLNCGKDYGKYKKITGNVFEIRLNQNKL